VPICDSGGHKVHPIRVNLGSLEMRSPPRNYWSLNSDFIKQRQKIPVDVAPPQLLHIYSAFVQAHRVMKDDTHGVGSSLTPSDCRSCVRRIRGANGDFGQEVGERSMIVLPTLVVADQDSASTSSGSGASRPNSSVFCGGWMGCTRSGLPRPAKNTRGRAWSPYPRQAAPLSVRSSRAGERGNAPLF
jgi:hypothetical protein